MTDLRKETKREVSHQARFADIHREFEPKILRYLRRLVGDQEAEDLTQEVFLKVNQSLKTFRGRSKLSTWVYRIATNAAIDRLRSSSSRRDDLLKTHDEATETEGRNLWTGEKELSLEEQLMLKEMLDCFREFIDRLSPPYRTVVVLGDLEEFSNADIAEILGLSLETVKIRLHRGRSRLYQDLRAHCPPEEWPIDLIRGKS